MARDSSPLGRFVLDKTPYHQNNEVLIAPTTGTQAQETIVCYNLLDAMQKLYAMCVSQRTELQKEFDNFRKASQATTFLTPRINDFQEKRLVRGETAADLIMDEMQELCDASKPDKIFANIKARMFVDVGLATPNYLIFCRNIEKIATRVMEIKLDAKKNKEEIVIKPISELESGSTLVSFPFEKVKYCMEIYMILPGGEKVIVDQFLKEMAYHRLFDSASMPIFTCYFIMPFTIMRHIKAHDRNIKWFMNINMLKKNEGEDDGKFQLPTNIYSNVELTPIDPIYDAPEYHKDSETESMPMYQFKVDLVSTKDTKMNSFVSSKVYTECRLIDVLADLSASLKEYYKSLEEPTEREIKISISPPDNTKVYEQILVEPGSFTQVIYTLQEKYGIYHTGVRVNFETVKTVLEGGEEKNETICTVLGKGEAAPGDNVIKDVIIDLVDPNAIDKEAQITEPFYTTGQYIDKTTGMILLRTYDPYTVTRKNSDYLVTGEALRVMNSSSEEHHVSHCDSVDSDIGMARLHWAKYDNPFTLTQLQDSVREGEIEVVVQARDINAMALSNNQTYRLEFYGDNDKVYSGDYRLSKLSWWYRFGNGVKATNDVEVSCAMLFVNQPTLKVNGTEVSN